MLRTLPSRAASEAVAATSAASAAAAAAPGAAARAAAKTRIPEPSRLPLVNHIATHLKFCDANKKLDQMGLHEAVYRAHGPVYRFNPMCLEGVFVTTSAFLDVFKKEGLTPRGLSPLLWPLQAFIERRPEYATDNKISQNGAEWKASRRKLQPFLFSHDVAKAFQPMMVAPARRASAAFAAAAASPSPGALASYTGRAAFDAFCAFALDAEVDSVGGNHPLAQRFCALTSEGMADMVQLLIYNGAYEMAGPRALGYFPQYLRFEEKWAGMCDMAGEMVRAALRERPSGAGVVHKMVAEGGMSEHEAADFFFSMLLASVDTTGDTLMRTITLLADYPEAQRRLREELRRELGGGDYHPGADLPYLRAVFHESERVRPASVQGIVRLLDADVDLEGYRIPKDTPIFFSKIAAMVDEDVAGAEPRHFRPERFLPEAVAARKAQGKAFLDHPIVRTPFSFGPRMCVGARIAMQELNTLLARIVQDHEILPAKGSRVEDPSTRTYRVELSNRPCPVPVFDVRRL